MNKASNNVAEIMEGRASTKGNCQQCAPIQTQSWDNTRSRLLTVREAAGKDRKCQFTNLFHYLTQTLLEQSFWKLKRHSAAGCDGVTWEEYALDLHNYLRECLCKNCRIIS
jgi:RNA-directed DNA polymerase